MPRLARRALTRGGHRIADKLDRRALRKRSFSIIANDCWGAEVYRALDLPYRTPFVGLVVHGPCFITLLRSFRTTMAQPLSFTAETRYDWVAEDRRRRGLTYPIARLGQDVEIHFLHEASPQIAADKWNRRVERIDWRNLYIKLSDGKDGVTEEHVAEFDRLPYAHKVALVERPYRNIASAVAVRRYDRDGAAMYRLAQPDFDVIRWLNGEDPRTGRGSKLVRRYRAI